MFFAPLLQGEVGELGHVRLKLGDGFPEPGLFALDSGINHPVPIELGRLEDYCLPDANAGGTGHSNEFHASLSIITWALRPRPESVLPKNRLTLIKTPG